MYLEVVIDVGRAENKVLFVNAPRWYPVSHPPHFSLSPLFPTDVEPSKVMYISIYINVDTV